MLQAVEHPSTTQSTSSAILLHQLCPMEQTSALTFPRFRMNLQYLFGFHLLFFVLCVWFGDSFSSLCTCCFSCSFAFFMLSHVYVCMFTYISMWTQCIPVWVLIFNSLNKGVEGEGLWVSKTSLPGFNKHGRDVVCFGLGLLAEPEMLEGRMKQWNTSSTEATNTGRSLVVSCLLLQSHCCRQTTKDNMLLGHSKPQDTIALKITCLVGSDLQGHPVQPSNSSISPSHMRHLEGLNGIIRGADELLSWKKK